MAKQSRAKQETRYSGTQKQAKGDNWIQKNETLLMAMLLIVSLVVIIVILFPDLIGWKTTGTVPGTAETQTGEGIIINQTALKQVSTAECLAGYGLDTKTLVYIYSETCTASEKNTPWVLALKEKGYKIFMVETQNVSAMNMAASCLSGIVGFGGTPEYVCPATANERLGAFDSDIDLTSFADTCK